MFISSTFSKQPRLDERLHHSTSTVSSIQIQSSALEQVADSLFVAVFLHSLLRLSPTCSSLSSTILPRSISVQPKMESLVRTPSFSARLRKLNIPFCRRQERSHPSRHSCLRPDLPHHLAAILRNFHHPPATTRSFDNSPRCFVLDLSSATAAEPADYGPLPSSTA